MDTNQVATTDINGNYIFDNLQPGEYSVKFEIPAGYAISPKDQGNDDAKDSDVDPSTAMTEQTTLVPGESDTTWDMGLWKPKPGLDVEKHTNGADADDANGDDVPSIKKGSTVTWTYIVRNTGTDVIQNINVVDDKEGSVTCPKSTLNVGESMTCTKTGVAIGDDYENIATANGVGVVSGESTADTDPSHYSGYSSGRDDNNGSTNDGNSTTPGSGSGAHIGDYFWIDSNDDGIQDADEKPISGALVELLDKDGNPAKDINGNTSTHTDANGHYGFDVAPGDYRIKFTIPKKYLDLQYIFTVKHNAAEDKDSDVSNDGITDPIHVENGDDIRTIDAGIDCGCSDIKSDSIDSLNTLGVLLMIFALIAMQIGFAKREELYND